MLNKYIEYEYILVIDAPIKLWNNMSLIFLCYKLFSLLLCFGFY